MLRNIYFTPEFIEGHVRMSARLGKRVYQKLVREHEVLRVSASLGGADPSHSMHVAIREIVAWAQNRRGQSLPAEAWDGKNFDFLAGGRNFSAVRVSQGNLDIWAMRADEPDKFVASRSWTAEAIIAKLPDNTTKFSSRLLANTSEEHLNIDAAVPGFIHQILNLTGISSGEIPILDNYTLISDDNGADHLLDLILNERRLLPVVVIAVPDTINGVVSAPFNVSRMAAHLIGLAHFYVIPAAFTWIISDRLGRRLSVFDNGIRIYDVGFSDDDSPFSGYPLILGRDLQTDSDILHVARWIRNALAYDSIRRGGLGSNFEKFSVVKSLELKIRQEKLFKDGASDELQLEAAALRIETLEKQLAENIEWQSILEEDNQISNEKLVQSESKNAALKFRIEQLKNQLQTTDRAPDAGVIVPTRWEGFSDWCDDNLAGRLVLTPSARKGTKAPLFEDASAAARALLWLANEYRDARMIGGDNSLRDYFIESGVKNSPCGSDSYITHWRGKNRTVEWHIKNGGNTRSPERCLRIYYFWDEDTHQIVISDMPEHKKTDAS